MKAVNFSVRLFWPPLLFLMALAGCAHLHVDLQQGWSPSQVQRVQVAIDRAPASQSAAWFDEQIGKQLVALAWQASPRSQAQVEAKLFWQWRKDLTEDNVLIYQPASLHLRIESLPDQQLVALADYFYPRGGEPDHLAALEAVFTGLTRQPEVAPAALTEPVSTPPVVAVPQIAPAFVPPAPLAQATVPGPAMPQQLPIAASAQNAEPVAPVTLAPLSPEQTRSSSITSGLPAVVPATQVPAPLRTMTRSPWLPRLESWGFEDWGQVDRAETLMD
ncbi:MAG: hypothetical protein M0O99_04565 [Desulfuromonas thiophila]|jgi:hypothetical protein|nr:hypothetical protein [Desulfuromonas thiophila]